MVSCRGDYNFEFEDFLDEEYEEQDKMPPHMMSLFMEYEKNLENQVAPDTTGVDKYFIKGFFTGKMEYDFETIAHDFLIHHFQRVQEFNKLAVYGNDHPSQSDPDTALKYKILNVIYNAAKSGDEYSVELIKYLYKTYHKKEYKQLKRFKKITVPEIFSLSETEDMGCDYTTVARILGMCNFYGIELEEKVSILYLLFGRVSKESEEEDSLEFLSFREGLFQECYEQVEEWMAQIKGTRKYRDKSLNTYWKADAFAEKCLKRHGYPDYFLNACDDEFYGLNRLFAGTLAVLKSIYPDEDFSFEDVQIYAMLMHCVDSLVSVCEAYDENISEILGIAPDRYELEDCLFKPENIVVRDTRKPNNQRKPAKPMTQTVKDVKDEDYLNEIHELRRRLRMKEEECRHFRQQYEQAREELKNATEIIAQNENNMEELINLRNFVYSLSQEDVPVEEEKLEDMKKHISEKDVVIIGGHINWINKLRKEFPNWRYLDANISRVHDKKLVEGAEKVYFFTDHLSHGIYARYVKLIRDCGIPFGYMHSVNIGTLIKQVYVDLAR